jgi:hypothetical protein
MRTHRQQLLAIAIATLPMAASGFEGSVGGDLALLLREEGGGNRTALPSLSARLAVPIWGNAAIAGSYAFAYDWGSSYAKVTAQYHRLFLTPEYSFPVRRMAFRLGLGPALTLTHASLYDRNRLVASATVVRPGVVGGVGIDVQLGSTILRAGSQALWSASRLDFLFGVGASYRFGQVAAPSPESPPTPPAGEAR